MSNQRHAFRTNCPHKYGAEIHIDRKILSAMGNSNPGIICISAPYWWGYQLVRNKISLSGIYGIYSFCYISSNIASINTSETTSENLYIITPKSIISVSFCSDKFSQNVWLQLHFETSKISVPEKVCLCTKNN